jgi:hypothetical protein
MPEGIAVLDRRISQLKNYVVVLALRGRRQGWHRGVVGIADLARGAIKFRGQFPARTGFKGHPFQQPRDRHAPSWSSAHCATGKLLDVNWSALKFEMHMIATHHDGVILERGLQR